MRGRGRIGIQLGLVGAGVMLIVIGIFADDLRVVLQKAVYICLECIGIG